MQLETVAEAATCSLRKLEILVTENIHKQKQLPYLATWKITNKWKNSVSVLPMLKFIQEVKKYMISCQIW